MFILDEKDRLLLLKRADNFCWGPPGGAVEPGEIVEVVGAKVVTPLGDAVGFVHGEQAQACPERSRRGQGLKRAEEGHVAEAFGCDVDQSVFPLR